jgi:RimJ/RimL family protein N-acetyltransferase
MHDSSIALSRLLRTPPASTASRPSSQTEWRRGLPELAGRLVALRELTVADAESLVPLLTAPEVARFMTPTPEAPNWFEAFVTATAQARRAGRYAGFAIVPHGESAPVGLTQVRQVAPGFSTAEWGIAIGSAWWGKGLFEDVGHLILPFAFDTLGAHRVEARVATPNVRGNAAVAKLGAVPEGVLRRALRTAEGLELDQVLWAWLAEEWRRGQATRRSEVPVWVH